MSRATSEGLVMFRMPSPAALVGAEIRSIAARRALSAEFLGTLLLVFFTVGVMIVTGGMLGERLSSSRLLVTAMAHGMAFGLLVFTMLGASGGHLNPIMTVGAMVTHQMTLTRGLMYIAAQLVGAITGAFLLKLAMPAGMAMTLGVPMLGARVTAEAALVVEGILAFMLTMVFLAAAGKPSAPAMLGMTTVLGRLFGTALTGAPMNPALVFGVGMMAGVWSGHWIWWVGPVIGSVLAAVCWRSWFSKGDGGRHSGDGRAWR